jgi:GrpB-like predicted nucleotidyltransferase (UPF0157 family)
MLLVIANSADEAAGYRLQVRDPDWCGQRMFKGPEADISLRVFSQSCEEIDRVLPFRDWLRTHENDRRLYEGT